MSNDREQDTIDTTKYEPTEEQEKLRHAGTEHRRYSRTRTIFQSLAAILIVGILLGSLTLLIAHRHSAQATSSGTINSPLVTVASTDGTVYAIHAQSGTVAWQYPTHEPIGTMVQRDGAVYVSTEAYGATSANSLYKFIFSDGSLL